MQEALTRDQGLTSQAPGLRSGPRAAEGRSPDPDCPLCARCRSLTLREGRVTVERANRDCGSTPPLPTEERDLNRQEACCASVRSKKFLWSGYDVLISIGGGRGPCYPPVYWACSPIPCPSCALARPG